MSEIFIYDDIGPDWLGMVSAKSVLSEIDKSGRGSSIVVRINSPGGDVVEAQAIYNALRRHSDNGGNVTVEVDALAASAASYIAMAGDTIRIAENAMMMIHNAWTIALGNADQLRGTADVLDKFDQIISTTYSKRSKASVDAVLKMMADETWMTADEALDYGFADELGQSMNVAASVKEGRFAKTPGRFLQSRTTPATETLSDTMDADFRLEILRQKIRLTRAR